MDLQGYCQNEQNKITLSRTLGQWTAKKNTTTKPRGTITKHFYREVIYVHLEIKQPLSLSACQEV